ncbi:hypothetical protein CYMTET_50563 [Cymbomonas tetramitiformis]|uniref:EF-hand domain-containing protein n=1 Tax=Cymbomonas tetramitiformis TaxID=36881 RepID=A0AAE0BNY5_9CHLO|nr:hypothetical protein CYMTET_50563 [Cymbomonas tetramitiformis]
MMLAALDSARILVCHLAATRVDRSVTAQRQLAIAGEPPRRGAQLGCVGRVPLRRLMRELDREKKGRLDLRECCYLIQQLLPGLSRRELEHVQSCFATMLASMSPEWDGCCYVEHLQQALLPFGFKKSAKKASAGADAKEAMEAMNGNEEWVADNDAFGKVAEMWDKLGLEAAVERLKEYDVDKDEGPDLLEALERVVAETEGGLEAYFKQFSDGGSEALNHNEFEQMILSLLPDMTENHLRFFEIMLDKTEELISAKHLLQHMNNCRVVGVKLPSHAQVEVPDVLNKLLLYTRKHNLNAADVFQKFDRDRDGALREEELLDMLAALMPALTEEEIGHVLAKWKSISFRQMQQMLRRVSRQRQDASSTQPSA